MAEITYHGVPEPYWRTLAPAEPYVPPDFEREGFIHCTDGREAISTILTQYYKEDANDWLILTVDKNRIAAPVKYEDPAGIFPHVYGPLNRDAIVDVRTIERAADGTFLLPGQGVATPRKSGRGRACPAPSPRGGRPALRSRRAAPVR